MRILAIAALATALAGSALTAASAHDQQLQRRTLSVTGSGEVTAAPDMAMIDIGVSSDARTAREALDENTASMTKVMAALTGAGIAAKDLQTRGFAVEPRYHHDPKNNRPPRVVGYQVRNTVHAIVRDLDNLGRTLDVVVTEGSNRINGLSFTFSDPKSLMSEARRKAGGDARTKAELYAEGLGITLGSIVSVQEHGGPVRPPQPVMARAMAMEAAVPVAAGEQAVTAQVSVVWEIAD